MVVINYEEQLQPGTFEHAIHYLIDDQLDLSVYYQISGIQVLAVSIDCASFAHGLLYIRL